jgi:putative hydrolase of the HAD superfamily
VIEAVFLDLFETLVTLFDPDWRPRPSAGERLGVDPRAFDEEWQARRPLRFAGAFPDYREALRDICRSLRHTPDETVIEQLYEERLAVLENACTQTSDEVMVALEGLDSLGIRLGVVSNSVPELVASWPRSPVQRFVHDVVFSHEVGCAKPQSEIYLLACRRLGVTPEQSIFVGDGDNDELAGAGRLGMRPYWATWFLDLWPVDARVESISERSMRYPRLRTPADLVRAVRMDHLPVRKVAPDSRDCADRRGHG